MKIIYSWLSDFIENPPAPAELAAKLGRIGLKVEELKKTGAAFSGVCVAQILKIDKHPNADKLALVDVNDGKVTMRVVCGAKNIAVGQKIPFAKVGAMLSGGELKKAKIRGVDSEGMLCSEAELGLCPPGADDGILILPAGTIPHGPLDPGGNPRFQRATVTPARAVRLAKQHAGRWIPYASLTTLRLRRPGLVRRRWSATVVERDGASTPMSWKGTRPHALLLWGYVVARRGLDAVDGLP